jgi:hypothetical protein
VEASRVGGVSDLDVDAVPSTLNAYPSRKNKRMGEAISAPPILRLEQVMLL